MLYGMDRNDIIACICEGPVSLKIEQDTVSILKLVLNIHKEKQAG